MYAMYAADNHCRKQAGAFDGVEGCADAVRPAYRQHGKVSLDGGCDARRLS